MGFLKDIVGIAAPIVGTALGGPVGGAGLAAATNRGAYHTAGDAVSAVATDQVGRAGGGLHPQRALVVHPHLQGHIVRGPQKVGAGGRVGVAVDAPVVAGPGAVLAPMAGDEHDVHDVYSIIAIQVAGGLVAVAGDTAPTP